MIKACIFDLDGVVVDTAKFHFLAWKRIAAHLDYDFTEEQNEQLKGISRMASLEKILELADITVSKEDKEKFCLTKNNWYLDLIKDMNSNEILPGVSNLIAEMKKNNLKIAIGSASKNARTILDQINLTAAFDTIVDGTQVVKSKPDPEVFLKAAELMGVRPSETIVIEDSEKGLEAAKNGGFLAVGLGEANLEENSDLVVKTLEGLSLSKLLSELSKNGTEQLLAIDN